MEELKRSSVTETTPISRTEKEKLAYREALIRFEKEMKTVRADAIYRSAQSQISASKTILNR